MARDVQGSNLFFGKARRSVRNALKHLEQIERLEERELNAFNQGKIQCPMMAFDVNGVGLKPELTKVIARLENALAKKIFSGGKPDYPA